MRMFHIGDVLCVTTGKVVSSRNMDGFRDILNFLTGDDLHTHQLPRALQECEPWLRSQFPNLMYDAAGMPERLEAMDNKIEESTNDREKIDAAISEFVESLRVSLGLPDMLPVYELAADMHTHIHPLEEAKGLVKDKCLIAFDLRS